MDAASCSLGCNYNIDNDWFPTHSHHIYNGRVAMVFGLALARHGPTASEGFPYTMFDASTQVLRAAWIHNAFQANKSQLFKAAPRLQPSSISMTV